MLQHGGGSIVTLSSVLAIRPGPVLGYGVAKAGIINLTQSLAVQWGKKNIRVNAICPGWVDTPFIRKQEEAGRDLSPIIEMTPLGDSQSLMKFRASLCFFCRTHQAQLLALRWLLIAVLLWPVITCHMEDCLIDKKNGLCNLSILIFGKQL